MDIDTQYSSEKEDEQNLLLHEIFTDIRNSQIENLVQNFFFCNNLPLETTVNFWQKVIKLMYVKEHYSGVRKKKHGLHMQVWYEKIINIVKATVEFKYF